MTTRNPLPKNLRPMLNETKIGSVTIIQNGKNVTIPEVGYVRRCASFRAAERLIDNLVSALRSGKGISLSNPCAVGLVCAPRCKVNRYALRRGARVEREHTRNGKVARIIAMAHLAERPDYYTRLAKMERNPATRIPMLEIMEVADKKIALDGESICMDRPRLTRYYNSFSQARRIFKSLSSPIRLKKWMEATERLMAYRNRR